MIWKFVKTGQTWIKRVYVGLLVAASFSFFALHADGPAMRLEAQLKRAAGDYSQLRANVYQCLSLDLQSRIYQRSWNEAPRAFQSGIVEEQQLARERAELLAEYNSLPAAGALRSDAKKNF